jgi:hypothetical protein
MKLPFIWKSIMYIAINYNKQNEDYFAGEHVIQLEKVMAENNIYLIWSGHISPEVGKEVISFAEKKLTEDEIASNIRKKVFSILVEILENVEKYSPGKDAEEEFGMPLAMIRMKDKIYSLTTGNLILNSKVEELKAKIDDVNSYDKPGLKEAFRRSLSGQDTNTESTGNMGLIDMARKSGGKLMYQFDRISDMYSYYTLTVKVEEGAV